MEKYDYNKESEKNFLDRMHSQNTKKITEEDKKEIERRSKKLKNIEEKWIKKNKAQLNLQV